MKYISILLIALIFTSTFADEIYFPPLTGGNWETIDPKDLGWNTTKINNLYNFLEQKNTKAFLVLKDGRIVLEKYFDSFNKDSIWYWASAGKTLTATLVGIAQYDGLLDINDKTSKYLGVGWTSCPKEKEDLITIHHQLTMTTGLDYSVDDLDCTDPQCLKYKSDAGTQWYYHNAPYTLLEEVIVKASGQNYNSYFMQKIRNITGITGLWIKNGYLNIFYSTPRSMAKFGILMLNNGNWNTSNVIQDKEYLKEMINTSQNHNNSYGYLWWLNGKNSYMIPGSNKVFSGKLMPDAPDDLYAALGKNGQILNVVPSKGIVIVRLGERPDDQLFISTQFNNLIWQHLNQIIEGGTAVMDIAHNCTITQNPSSDYIEIRQPTEGFKAIEDLAIQIYNTYGILVSVERPSITIANDQTGKTSSIRINISHLPTGLYFVKIGANIEIFVVLR